MAGHGSFKSIYIKARPFGRDILLTGVGPCVAEMEINHQVKAERCGPSGLNKHIVRAVPAIGWIEPHAQTYGIDTAIVTQQTHTLLFFTRFRIESMALLFKLSEPAHIGSGHKPPPGF